MNVVQCMGCGSICTIALLAGTASKRASIFKRDDRNGRGGCVVWYDVIFSNFLQS